MNPITIPNITIPVIGLPTIGIPSVGFPSASGGGLAWPKGLKESIKAIYDPAKQGMTNYDVIESYAEDFTIWGKKPERATITVTNKTINITNVKSPLLSIIEDNRIPFSDLVVKVTGVSEETYLVARSGNMITQIIKTDGVYKISTNNKYLAFGVSKTGDCNIVIEQLPTSILKDLSGNGNHAYLYGGKGKLNSGMGVYQQDFTNTRNATTVSSDGFEVAKKGGTYLARISIGYWNNKECKLLFETNNTTQFYYIRYRKANNDIVATVRLYNGENIIPAQDDLTDVSEVIFEGIVGDNEYIRVTEIPDYPNQLCYDGKMYAVCYGFPILEDYTVMADRTWFEKKNRAALLSKAKEQGTGAFIFEIYYNIDETYSFGRNTGVHFVDNNITYCTKSNYNGTNIIIGDVKDTSELVIGTVRQEEYFTGYVGCHGQIIIADRSFTEDEITWLKDKFFTIDIPTPAYDFDFSKLKSGENTFTDKYGNELSLYNFAWNGMSGLGGYGIDVSEGLIQPNRFDYTYNNASKEFVFLKPLSDGTYLFNVKVNVVQSTQKIKFTNVNKPITFVRANTSNVYYTITKDGIYDIDFITDADTIIKENYVENEELNLKVQFLPNYPQALVFDGVDDYCKLSKMTIKTVILDVVPNKQVSSLYDNRLNAASNWFSILNGENKIIAYNSHNDGFTYINGELNTTVKPNEIMNERNVICVVNEKSEEANQFIGASISLSGRANMVLYRITGFTEVLTPDQVWKWYQKNKPKGGDK